MKLSRALLKAAGNATALACKLDRPADKVLSDFFRSERGLGSHDRPFIADTVFAVLRNKRLLETIVPQATPQRMATASLLKFQGVSISALEPLVDRTDRQWLVETKQVQVETLEPAVRLSLPDWLWQRLCDQLGEDRATSLGRSLLHPAPLDLRVNTLLAKRTEVLEKLAAESIAASPTPLSPIGIRLKDKPTLNRHELFLSGKVEVQDEGSQLLGMLVAPARGQMVVDFCAGAGGKTLLLGTLMHNQGRLYAFDVSTKRLDALKQRLKRSALSNVHPQMIGSERDPRIGRLAGKIDRVLVDAPCSGLGTLRRNPDMKWRQSPQSVTELVDKQRRILAASSRLPKPGGRLIYATCSLLAEENTQIVEAFLEDHRDRYRLVDCQSVLDPQQSTFNQNYRLETRPYFQIWPDTHGCDGFFAAVLERTSD